ncbi:hypothetical protein A2U01_0115297, partial [Trifolium medium]|nr:hypothetical protein [Trifolium medium]
DYGVSSGVNHQGFEEATIKRRGTPNL